MASLIDTIKNTIELEVGKLAHIAAVSLLMLRQLTSAIQMTSESLASSPHSFSILEYNFMSYFDTDKYLVEHFAKMVANLLRILSLVVLLHCLILPNRNDRLPRLLDPSD